MAGYLAGAIPFALLVGLWAKGIDIRNHGSGNVGATNALRTIGVGPSALVFALDFGKGALAAWLGLQVGGSLALAAACGVAAVVGHNWSIFIRLRGGRGVSTSLGAFVVLLPWACLIAIAVGVAIIIVTRYVSLGSVVGAALSTPLALAFFVSGAPLEPVIYALIASTIVVVRHHDNIARLLAGRENRIGQKATHRQ